MYTYIYLYMYVYIYIYMYMYMYMYKYGTYKYINIYICIYILIPGSCLNICISIDQVSRASLARFNLNKSLFRRTSMEI